MFKKLVRDNITEIMGKKGKNPDFYIANNEEYKLELFKKLLEEAEEVIEEKNNKEKLKEELWDLMEVLLAILKLENITFKEIEYIRKEKLKNRWWFDKKIILNLKQ